jgi:hypothetical protein
MAAAGLRVLLQALTHTPRELSHSPRHCGRLPLTVQYNQKGDRTQSLSPRGGTTEVGEREGLGGKGQRRATQVTFAQARCVGSSAAPDSIDLAAWWSITSAPDLVPPPGAQRHGRNGHNRRQARAGCPSQKCEKLLETIGSRSDWATTSRCKTAYAAAVAVGTTLVSNSERCEAPVLTKCNGA